MALLAKAGALAKPAQTLQSGCRDPLRHQAQTADVSMQLLAKLRNSFGGINIWICHDLSRRSQGRAVWLLPHGLVLAPALTSEVGKRQRLDYVDTYVRARAHGPARRALRQVWPQSFRGKWNPPIIPKFPQCSTWRVRGTY